jgi:hypothetical protein
MAVLCKPNVQYLPLIWAAVIALYHPRHRRRTLAGPVVLLALTAAALAPWWARNAQLFGRPFLSTAFEGNLSRVSAPAAIAWSRGEYTIPWSAEWDALFAEIINETAERHAWDRPWGSLNAREAYDHNRQVYLTARKALTARPGAWLASHLLGVVRYLEPQTYRVCYARASGREWPPDVLDDAVLHVIREIARGRWEKVGEIIVQQRWEKLTALQRAVWWGTFVGQAIGLTLACRGLWRLRSRRAHAAVLWLTVTYVLLVPGPIAYERFRIPVTSLILVLVGASARRTGVLRRRTAGEPWDGATR